MHLRGLIPESQEKQQIPCRGAKLLKDNKAKVSLFKRNNYCYTDHNFYIHLIKKVTVMANYRFFKKTNTNFSGEIELTQGLLQLLTIIDENKDIKRIALESKMSPELFKKSMVELLKAGLIKPVVKEGKPATKEAKLLSESVFKSLVNQFTVYVGPVAEMIIEDALSDLAVTDQQLPVEYLEKFLSIISEEIPSEEQKTQFYQNINKLIV